MFEINKVSNTTKDAIKRKSAYSLPDRPSDMGMKAEDIKRAFWQPIVDVTFSAITEIDRVVGEINLFLNNEFNVHIEDNSNPHKVTKSQVGLSECDNTADVDKPVSIPQRQALNAHNKDIESHLDIRKDIIDGLITKVNIADVIDNFNSSEINKPLSANRGKILYDSLSETIELLGKTVGKTDETIKNISLNSSDGIMTITKTNGESYTIDFPLEYIIKSGSYNAATECIELVFNNNEKITIPVSALIDEYYGDNATIKRYTIDGRYTFSLSQNYINKIENSDSQRHYHHNGSILNSITEPFTTTLKSNYDEYASKILKNSSDIASEISNREVAISTIEEELSRLEGLISASGTVVYVDGKPVSMLNIDELTVGMSSISEEAEKAKDYTASGSIARRFKKLEARINALEEKGE